MTRCPVFFSSDLQEIIIGTHIMMFMSDLHVHCKYLWSRIKYTSFIITTMEDFEKCMDHDAKKEFVPNDSDHRGIHLGASR